jgi:nitrite reductase (NADH) small subunit/3-phenylpropionate/trans-cinnamate dioxygenase ferredoxin subunit
MADLEQHAARIAELMRQVESGAEPPARESVFELLEHIDHLHRTCVWRLFELVTELGGKGLIDRVAADPAVKTLFVLYDLIPSEPLRPVVSSGPVTEPYTGGFIPAESLRLRGRPPDWKVAFAQSDLPPGSLQGAEIDGTPVLLCSVAEGVFAYRNGCGGGALPLHLGTLVNGEIRCPWHGCRYDVRTGKRLDRPGADLEPFAVAVRDGMVHVLASGGR